jgi:YHS domain-containing protein
MHHTTTRNQKWSAVLGTAIVIGLITSLTSSSRAADLPAKTTATAQKPGFRLTLQMPALLKRLTRTATNRKTSAPSQDVVDELREIYRQNGLAMPPMTLQELAKQKDPANNTSVKTIQHLAPAALPEAPPIEFIFTSQLAPTPAPALAPTPDPTHVQATLRRFRQRQQIDGRRHRGGLKGFCPVALKDRQELVDGRPEFNAVHQGRMILFSSKTAKTEFLARPDAYLPVAGGLDVVSVHRRQPSMGQLDHATWYRGRLHLFVTKANLLEFQQQPDRFER